MHVLLLATFLLEKSGSLMTVCLKFSCSVRVYHRGCTCEGMLFEAGLFESKIRIRYACVHLGGLQRRYLALTRSSSMLIVLGWVGVTSCFHVSSLLG